MEIGFEKGDPVSIDGVKMSPATVLTKLNELGGANGIGRVDIVESRCVCLEGGEGGCPGFGARFQGGAPVPGFLGLLLSCPGWEGGWRRDEPRLGWGLGGGC